MKKIKKEKLFGIDKNVFSLGWVSLLNDLSSEMVYPLLPLFLTQVLGAKVFFVGLIEGIAESTISLLKLFSGYLSDRLNKRKIIVLGGYTLSSLCRPLIALTTSYYQVLFIRFFDRLGKGIRTSPRDALISLCSPPEERGKHFSFQRAMDHVGAALGPLLAFILLSYFLLNLRYIFLWASIPGLISLLVIIWGVKEKHLPTCYSNSKDKDSKSQISLKSFNTQFKWFLIIIILFTLGNSSDAFLILRAKDLGIGLSLIPVLWLILHIVKSLSSLPAGIISDKIGRKKVIISGWLIYSLVYFGFAFSSSTISVWVLFAIYGLYFGLTEGVEKALVTDLVPLNLRGSAFGAYNFVGGIVSLPASLIAGILWEAIAPFAPFLFGATLSLISAILLLLIIKIK